LFARAKIIPSAKTAVYGKYYKKRAVTSGDRKIIGIYISIKRIPIQDVF